MRARDCRRRRAHNLLMLGPPGSGKTEDIPRHPAIDPAAPPRSDICRFSHSDSLSNACRNDGWPCEFWSSHATVLAMASEVSDAARRTPQWVTRTPLKGYPCKGFALSPSTAGD